MEIQWDIVLPPLTVIGALFVMYRWIDSKFDRIDAKFDRIDRKFDIQDGKIDAVRKASEDAHRDIRGDLADVRKASEDAHKDIRGDLAEVRKDLRIMHDDLCDLKVTTAIIKTDVEWLKQDRQQ